MSRTAAPIDIDEHPRIQDRTRYRGGRHGYRLSRVARIVGSARGAQGIENRSPRWQEESTERFRNEAPIIASLNHAHIVTIYDIGIAEGRLFIRRGRPAGTDKADGSWEQALDIIGKIGSGFAASSGLSTPIRAC
jgi:hypothetical protein